MMRDGEVFDRLGWPPARWYDFEQDFWPFVVRGKGIIESNGIELVPSDFNGIVRRNPHIVLGDEEKTIMSGVFYDEDYGWREASPDMREVLIYKAIGSVTTKLEKQTLGNRLRSLMGDDQAAFTIRGSLVQMLLIEPSVVTRGVFEQMAQKGIQVRQPYISPWMPAAVTSSV
jgi:hypothetical protein